MSSETATQQKAILTGDLDHVALSVRGTGVKLAEWYRDVLGFEPINFYNPDAFFPSVRLNAYTILDFFSGEKDDDENKGIGMNSHICIAIKHEDFESLLERLKKNNVEYTDPPKKRSGARGTGMSVYLKDPDGNDLEFRYYPHIDNN